MLKKLLAIKKWRFIKTGVIIYFAYASVLLQTLSLSLSLTAITDSNPLPFYV